MKIFLLTAFALTAFAFNSILCRMALATGEIDAASFTVIRLVSGTVTLAAIILALILFGCVQITMFGVSLYGGVRPGVLEWVGLVVAFTGLVFLVLPGLAAPPLMNALLMAAAGIAWGFYTLRGKGSEDPLADTAGNFLRSVPMVVMIGAVFISSIQISGRGAILAILSGALASGIGYSVWYAALKHHTPTRAAVLQLSVPVIAAVGGIVLLSETASIRLLIAAALILGGIGLTLIHRNR
jgi:drug/metabolite transporter (DMT)-like permease